MKAQRLLDWWQRPVPAGRLAALRVLVGAFAVVFLLVRGRSLAGVGGFPSEQFEPVGLASLLAQPLPPAVVTASVVLAIASGLGFTVGAWFKVTGPVFALLLLWVTTYRCSWGMVFHTENLLCLHVGLLAASPASDAYSLDARGRDGAGDAPSPDYGWAIRAMSLVTVVAYFLAGVAKLKLAGAPWLGGELLRAQIAYDNLRKLELGTQVSPLGPWLVRHRGVFPYLAVMTMFVELGAPLALLHRRVAWAWAIAAWCFHIGVLLLMSIGFAYQLSTVAYLSLFPVERAWMWSRQRLLRLRG